MTDLESLGWRNFFASQVDPGSEREPVRVLAVHRGRVHVAGNGFETSVTQSGNSAELNLTVGDWVLLDMDGPRTVSYTHLRAHET